MKSSPPRDSSREGYLYVGLLRGAGLRGVDLCVLVYYAPLYTVSFYAAPF